jgi:hypothetical protein
LSATTILVALLSWLLLLTRWFVPVSCDVSRDTAFSPLLSWFSPTFSPEIRAVVIR